MAKEPKILKMKIEEINRFETIEENRAYIIKGTVSSIANSRNGSFTLTGGFDEIKIVGSSTNKEALRYDADNNRYEWNNPNDFDAEEVTVDKEVTMKVVVYQEDGNRVAVGIILKVQNNNNKFNNLIPLPGKDKSKKKKEGFATWRKIWKKKPLGERIFLWIMFAFFLAYGFTLIFPLIWALINSFKPSVEYNIDSFAFPKNWTLDNYKKVFGELNEDGSSILESLWNSVWMSVVSTVTGLFASCLTSYVVAKYRFKMSGFIYALVIFVQVIPLVGGVAGMYQLIWKTLQIGDKPLVIWPIWFGGFGFSFLMLYSAFKSVPWSYAESAFIDGAGHFQTFFRIMLPSVKPVLASLFVVNFIGAWNDYMTSYLYLPSYQPLALTVYTLQDSVTRISYPAYLAVIVISVIPTIILFISFQKLIMENTTAGGLKG